MNNKGFIDIGEINIVGVLMGVIGGIVTVVVMAQVDEVGAFFKLLGFLAGATAGYFTGAKILGD